MATRENVTSYGTVADTGVRPLAMSRTDPNLSLSLHGLSGGGGKGGSAGYGNHGRLSLRVTDSRKPSVMEQMEERIRESVNQKLKNFQHTELAPSALNLPTIVHVRTPSTGAIVKTAQTRPRHDSYSGQGASSLGVTEVGRGSQPWMSSGVPTLSNSSRSRDVLLAPGSSASLPYRGCASLGSFSSLVDESEMTGVLNSPPTRAETNRANGDDEMVVNDRDVANKLSSFTRTPPVKITPEKRALNFDAAMKPSERVKQNGLLESSERLSTTPIKTDIFTDEDFISRSPILDGENRYQNQNGSATKLNLLEEEDDHDDAEYVEQSTSHQTPVMIKTRPTVAVKPVLRSLDANQNLNFAVSFPETYAVTGPLSKVDVVVRSSVDLVEDEVLTFGIIRRSTPSPIRDVRDRSISPRRIPSPSPSRSPSTEIHRKVSPRNTPSPSNDLLDDTRFNRPSRDSSPSQTANRLLSQNVSPQNVSPYPSNGRSLSPYPSRSPSPYRSAVGLNHNMVDDNTLQLNHPGFPRPITDETITVSSDSQEHTNNDYAINNQSTFVSKTHVTFSPANPRTPKTSSVQPINGNYLRVLHKPTDSSVSDSNTADSGIDGGLVLTPTTYGYDHNSSDRYGEPSRDSGDELEEVFRRNVLECDDDDEVRSTRDCARQLLSLTSSSSVTSTRGDDGWERGKDSLLNSPDQTWPHGNPLSPATPGLEPSRRLVVPEVSVDDLYSTYASNLFTANWNNGEERAEEEQVVTGPPRAARLHRHRPASTSIPRTASRTDTPHNDQTFDDYYNNSNGNDIDEKNNTDNYFRVQTRTIIEPSSTQHHSSRHVMSSSGNPVSTSSNDSDLVSTRRPPSSTFLENSSWQSQKDSSIRALKSTKADAVSNTNGAPSIPYRSTDFKSLSKSYEAGKSAQDVVTPSGGRSGLSAFKLSLETGTSARKVSDIVGHFNSGATLADGAGREKNNTTSDSHVISIGHRKLDKTDESSLGFNERTSDATTSSNARRWYPADHAYKNNEVDRKRSVAVITLSKTVDPDTNCVPKTDYDGLTDLKRNLSYDHSSQSAEKSAAGQSVAAKIFESSPSICQPTEQNITSGQGRNPTASPARSVLKRSPIPEANSRNYAPITEGDSFDLTHRNQIAHSNTRATQDGVREESHFDRVPIQLSSQSRRSVVSSQSSTSGRVIEVKLLKGPLGLGFCIEGGIDSPAGDKPITVKRVFKGDTSARDLLEVNDEILKVNEKPFSGFMSHFKAWNYLKSLPDGITILTIRRTVT